MVAFSFYHIERNIKEQKINEREHKIYRRKSIECPYAGMISYMRKTTGSRSVMKAGRDRQGFSVKD